MNDKRKLLLVSSGVFSLLLSGLTLLAVKGESIPLIGQDGYSSVKTNSITFDASDFKSGDGSIIKNGNPFFYTNVVVEGDKVIFKTGSSLKRSDTSGEGFYKGGIFYGMSIKGLDVNRPSAKIKHCGSERTWYKVINERGDGEYRGKFATIEKADKVGYHNISHSWTNNRDDNDPSSLWIEINNPELGAIEDEFSFTELTFTYDCIRSDSEYSTIMSRNLRDSYKFVSESGEDLPVHVKLGDTLRFKLQTLGTFGKEYDYKVTVSSTRNDAAALELSPNENGVYSLTIASQYNDSAPSSYTYLDIKKTEKVATAISTYEELKAMDPNGNYYLANDIVTEASDKGTTGLTSFSGVLDGNGHKISCPSRLRGSSVAGLFENLDGIVRNLKIEFFIGWYCNNPAGIAVNMNGGLIDNVDATIYFVENIDGMAAGLVSNMNKGTISNSKVTIIAPDSNIVAERCGAIAGILRKDGFIENCSALTLVDIATEINAVAAFIDSENNVKDCESKVMETLFDSALENGTALEETYKNSKVTTIPATHGQRLLKDFSFELIDSVYFYIKSDKNFTLDGVSTSIGTNWTLIEFKETSRGHWNLYSFDKSNENGYRTNTREDANQNIRNQSGFYDPSWKDPSYSGNVQTSPMFVKYKDLGTKVADSLINNSTPSEEKTINPNITCSYFAANFPQGGNLGGDDFITSYALPSSFDVITFGLKAKKIVSEDKGYAYNYGGTDGNVRAEALRFTTAYWTIYEITKNSDGTYKIDASTNGNVRTVDNVSMNKLNDFFSVFVWADLGVYSTPVFVK